MKQILIACIGNIFHGDDAFGVEVARRLRDVPLGDHVLAVDFGIRGYDLAYSIADGYEAVILVDAAARGGKPGTLYLMELDPENLTAASARVHTHGLDPGYALQMARSFGAKLGMLYLVGCEPATLDCEDGRMELSAAVAGAIPQAVEMIKSLVGEITEKMKPQNRKDDYAVFE